MGGTGGAESSAYDCMDAVAARWCLTRRNIVGK
jgi:hypothetical protein